MQLDARRALLGAVVVSLVATGALAILTLLLGDFGETEGRILLTTASISFYSLLCLPAAVLLDRGGRRPLALATLGLAVLGFLSALRLLWLAWDDAGETDWKSHLVVTVLALATTQVAATESRRRDDDPVNLRRLALASHASAAVSAFLATVAILQEVEDERFFRALAAIVVGNVLLVALQPVVRRMGSAAATQRVVCVLESGERIEYEVAARDFAAAAERAIRELERDGRRVRAVERG